MPSRRQHQKTRHGCTQCKAKRVKCDEEQPSCRRCARAHSHCSLLDSRPLKPIDLSNLSLARIHDKGIVIPYQKPILTFIDFQSVQSSPSDVQNLHDVYVIEDPVPPLALTGSQFGPLELELLHHYTTMACFFLSNIPSKQQIWQQVVPREALEYDFLLHSVLAISAVHLRHTCPSRDQVYEEQARVHRNLALTLSIPLLNNVTSTNCHALFALTTIVAMLAFISPEPSGPVYPSSPIDHIVDFFVLIRGAKTVFKSASEWIDKGPFAPLIRFRWNLTLMTLPDDVQMTFIRLIKQNEETTVDAEYRFVYDLAIQDLKVTFQTYRIISDEPALVFMWAKIVQEPYLAALKRLEPMALSILACYAVLLHSLNGQWWLEDRGSQLIKEIIRKLPPEWLPAVQWPLDVIHGDWGTTLDVNEAGRPWWDLFMNDLHKSKIINDFAVQQDLFDFQSLENQGLLDSCRQKVPGSLYQVLLEHSS